MPLNLSDEQCLLWIKDPTISPLVNKKTNKRRFIFDNNLDNPKKIFNTVKDACFYNSALRPKIIEQINKYQKNETLRLYTLNDKIKDNFEYIDEYIDIPFTKYECEQWTNNILVDPRTNNKIDIESNIFIELIYSSIQYNIELSFILNIIEPISNKRIYYKLRRIIKKVKERFELMKKNDDFFLNHDVESFDKKLEINDIMSYKKPKAKDSFDVSSSSSYKGLNQVEKRQLRDIILMNEKKKKLVKEYQYKKELMSKKNVDKKNVDNYIFEVFMKFLVDLQNEVMNGQLINNILKDATEGAKARITVPIDVYLRRKKHDESSIQNILKENNYDTIEGVISNFINNIYVQLINLETEFNPDLAIGFLSYYNKSDNFKNAELIKKISNELFNFTKEYSFIGYDIFKIFFIKYFKNIVEDTIPRDFVEKIKFDIRTKTYSENRNENNGDYINFYYKLVWNKNTKREDKIRLPEGAGLLIGKELTKAIKDLDEPYFNDYYEHRVITDDNVLNGFTYEECKKWVTLPIINPRTFKQILIDSPIYNRLLCMSYQYNTKLIPRMITSRGHYILLALTNVIENILRKEKKIAQSRDQLEKYIIDKEAQYTKKKEEKNIVSNKVGLKWKNVGTKHPKGGINITNEKLMSTVIKSISSTSTNKLPFYIFLTEEDLEKIGSSTAITKNSYIEITTYYIPDVPIVNRTSSSKIGLKWKRIGVKYPKEGDEIKKEGIEIINKKLTEALLKLNDANNNSPSSFIFSEEDLVSFGITTAIAKNSYIKITYYYMPVADKSFSDFIFNSKSNVVITNRNSKYSINKYYTIADCLRWANQPNRDPIIPDKIFKTDSPEYNIIFEQALLYDYDITPINITSKGIKFMNSVIKIKEKLLTIADKPKFPTSRGKYIEDINTKMCIAINNIYDDETNDIGIKYKKFKNKMIEKCEKYNKDSFMCIKDIRNFIEEYFYPKDNHAKEYKINYYQDSALASLLIFYEGIKNKIYKDEFRDIFIHDFNKFSVDIYEIDDELNERKKDAIDAGGPKREFFTKLFEELFCDDEHLTRPFISPNEIIDNKYCINPNFVPDENFRKVIEAYNKQHTPITKFNTERDYEYIYFVIGKLLCLTVVNEMIGLPKQFSTYILAGLINQPYELNKYDMLYFYLRDFHNATSYINMISKSSKIDDLDKSYLFFNNMYIVSKASQKSSGDSSGEQINKDNCIKFLLQLSKHVVAKNCLIKEKINSEKSMKKRYDSLFGGFSNEIRKFLYRKKFTIEQLSLLITNEQLTIAILRELVSKLEIYMEIKYTPNSFIGVYTGSKMSDAEQKERCDELKGYISNIIIQRRQDETEKEHINFVKNLLRFWTGLTYYDKTKPYKICYKYGVEININYLPHSHTCMYTLDIFGFRIEDSHAEREKFIYDKLKLAVGEQKMELH